ncbi:MAG TPA: hypothetical protein PLI18_18600 [Pirellulaceae bacterium]|nr:hypothetical protein [Pirellulaceae bacterium]
MTVEGATVRTIDWRSVTPWNLLFRLGSLAASPTLVLLALVGVLAGSLWWTLGGIVFSIGDAKWRDSTAFAAVIEGHESPGRPISGSDTGGVAPVAEYLASPFAMLLQLRPDSGLQEFAYLIWGAFGTLAVWSLIGGALARIAVMRLGRDEHVGPIEALKFAVRRYPAFFCSALYPLGLLIPLALVGAAVGLVMRWDAGAAIVSIAWGLGLAVSFVLSVLLIGILFGWPLMIVTVAAEGTDSLDGLSRGFAYPFQRPVHYAFYLVVGGAIAVGAVWVASILAMQVGQVTWWSVSWGMGAERTVELMTEAERLGRGVTLAADDETPPRLASGTIALWERLVGAMLVAFRFACFWSLAAGIYLLLRRDVDETEFDELFSEGGDPRSLPDLDARQVAPEPKSDEGSRPTAATAPPATAPTTTDTPGAEPPRNEPPKNDAEPDEPVRDE